jgi:hypothetical protein
MSKTISPKIFLHKCFYPSGDEPEQVEAEVHLKMPQQTQDKATSVPKSRWVAAKKGRKAKEKAAFKGNKMKLINTSPANCKRESNYYAGKSCDCKHVNHWEGIPWETTYHYRLLMYGEGSSQYSREAIVRKLIAPILEEAVCNYARKGRRVSPNATKLTYKLQCAVTGRITPVCFKVFCRVLGLSDGTVHKYVQKLKNGEPLRLPKKTAEAQATVRDSPEYLAIASFLEALAEDLANMSPDMRVTELPSGTKIQYYELFCETWKAGVLTGVSYRSRHRWTKMDQPPSKSLFYKVWREEFSALHVPKRQNRFSKCDFCTQCKTNISAARSAGDVVELNFWKEKLYRHYQWVVLQRKKYHRHRRKAAENPSK